MVAGSGSGSGSVSVGAQSIDEFFASFAYTGSKNQDPRSPAAGVGGGNNNPKRATERSSKAAKELSPKTPPPPQPPCSRRKKKTPSSFQPSNLLRTTIEGKPVVVSKYFPLPPSATPPIVIDKRAVDRAANKRLSMMRTAVKTVTRNKRKVSDKEKGKKMINDDDDDTIGEDDEEGSRRGKRHQNKKKGKRNDSKQRSLLSAAEKKCDAYRRVSDDNTWEAPFSCYNLLQERHSFDPWRVLVICMLLNLTTGEQVKKVLPGLFLLCRDAEEATKVSEEELVRLLQPLGLHRKRARTIKNFSREYLGSEWTHVTQLPGVGKYAADAYAIFCAGRPEDVIPEDHKLVLYWKLICEKRAQEKLQQQQQSLPQ